ncbi:MAG: hypothetical protein ACLP50_28100 [Solirubrobacteraceae bacterium]
MKAVGERRASSWSWLRVGVRGGEDDLDEHLPAPFADPGFDHGVGAGYALVAVVPVGGEVVDGAEVGVDGQFVPGGVVAGGVGWWRAAWSSRSPAARVPSRPEIHASSGRSTIASASLWSLPSAGGSPSAGAGAVVVVEHPPARDRVAELDGVATHGAALDMSPLSCAG